MVCYGISGVVNTNFRSVKANLEGKGLVLGYCASLKNAFGYAS